MVTQISSLIVAPEVNASKYTPGAADIVSANKAMAASSRETGATVTDTSAKIGTAGDVLARLSRQYDPAIFNQMKFNRELGQMGRALESGKMKIGEAEQILVGMNRRLGLTADSSSAAANGQMALAAAVERANARINQQTAMLTELSVAEARAAQQAENQRQAAAANQQRFNQVLKVGQPTTSALASAGVFEAEFDRMEQIAVLKAQHIGSLFQQELNQSFGLNNSPLSARSSALVFEEAGREAERMATKVAALRAELNPLAAAQDRVNAEIAEYAMLAQRGMISADEFAQAQAMVRARGGESSGAARAAAFNAGQQVQDIAMMSLIGQDPRVIALQQGPQLATAIQQGGGIAALGAGLASVFSTTTLLTIGITAAAAATVQWFTKGKDGADSMADAISKSDKAVRSLADAYKIAGFNADALSRKSVSAAEAAARMSERELQRQLRSYGKEIQNQTSPSDYMTFGLLGGGRENDVDPRFAAFTGQVRELRKLLVSGKGDFDTLERIRSEIDSIADRGYSPFRTFVDDMARMFGLEPESLRETADVLQKIITDAADATQRLEQLQNLNRNGRRDRVVGPARMDAAAEAGRELLEQQRRERMAQFANDEERLAAQLLQQRARTNAERLAAAERMALAEGGDVRSDVRVRRALAEERTRQEVEARDAAIQRAQSIERSLQQQRLELDLIGKTGGEQTKLRFEFERMQELREQAARTGAPIDQKEVALIRAAAAEMARYADALALARLGNDLQFERDQLARTPLDQQVASQLRGIGQAVDLDGEAAREIRINAILKQRVGIWNEIRDTGMDAIDQLVSSASRGFDDIGETFEGIASDITRQILQLSVANPLKNAIYGAGLPTLDDIGGAGGFLGTLLGQTANPASGFQSVGAMTVNAGSVMLTGSIGMNAGADILDRLFASGKMAGEHQPTSTMSSYAAAIRSIESAGNGGYSALGPLLSNGNQALGAYGIMQSNLPSWSMEALGRRVSRAEFMASPSIQDAIFENKFGSYISKYGNPQDAASTWFTGRPLASGKNAVDVLGTSGAAYVDKFNRALGVATGGATDFSKGLQAGLGDIGKGMGDLWKGLGSFLQSPTGGGSSWFQGLSSMFGGISGAMNHMLSISPAATGNILTGSWGLYDRGGYTGDGDKYQVAGLAHRGEFYFSKEATANLGVDYLSSLHEAGRRGRGLASGGFAGGAGPAGSRAVNPSNQGGAVRVVVNNYGEPAEASVHQSTDADGNTMIEVMMERKIDDRVLRSSSPVHRQLKSMGLQTPVTRR